LVDSTDINNGNALHFRSTQVVPNIELHTIHEADTYTILEAIYDPEYRKAKDREYQQTIEENKARKEAFDRDY
jgi:hypothetical protein